LAIHLVPGRRRPIVPAGQRPADRAARMTRTFRSAAVARRSSRARGGHLFYSLPG